MASDRERREQDRLRERNEAQALVENVNQELSVDKQRAAQRWESCRQQAQEALQISSESSRIREDMRREMLQQETQSVEVYERVKEQRDQKLREKRDKETGRRRMLEMQAAQRVSIAKRGESEAAAKAAAQLAEKNQKLAEAEQEKLRHLAEKKLQTQAYLMDQMRRKKEIKQVDQERLRQQRMLHEGDAKQYIEEEQQKAINKRMLNLQHRAELERQMATRCVVKGPNKELMSDTEAHMNRALLDRAVDEH